MPLASEDLPDLRPFTQALEFPPLPFSSDSARDRADSGEQEVRDGASERERASSQGGQSEVLKEGRERQGQARPWVPLTENMGI